MGLCNLIHLVYIYISSIDEIFPPTNINFEIRPSKKNMFWFSDNGFQKKGKVGMVFIYFFYFQSNMGRAFIFCFYYQRVKNITQTRSILLFWQTNNTIVFTRRDLDFPTDTSYIRSKLTKGLLFSPTAIFFSVRQ